MVNTVNNMSTLVSPDDPKCPEASHIGDTHTRILDAAEAIIRNNGIKALSMRAIAERTGLTAPAAYRHFAGKEAILDAVIERGFRNFMEGLQEARRGKTEPEMLLRASLRYYIEYWLNDPVSFALMLERNRDLQYLSGASIRRGSFGDLKELVEAAVGSGHDPAAIEAAGRFLAACLQGITMSFVADQSSSEKQSPAALSASIDLAVEYLCRSVKAFMAGR